MTEHFECPEPSDEALRAYDAMDAGDGIIDSHDRRCLHAAMKVDLPALCRQEVEAALLDQLKFADTQERFRYERVSAYLLARFGVPEAAPEQGARCPECDFCAGKERPFVNPLGHVCPRSVPVGEPGERCGHGRRETTCANCRAEVDAMARTIDHISPTAPVMHRSQQIKDVVAGSPPEEPKCLSRQELLDRARQIREEAEARRDRSGEPTGCTACACVSCRDRKAFVTLIADALARNDNRSLSCRLETYGGALLVEAARKVQGGKP